MNKSGNFDKPLQELSRVSKALSHPARLSILKYLAEAGTCISGDISDCLPLGRTTVSQHLRELKEIGMIRGEIEGLKINYCLDRVKINQYVRMFDVFFREIGDIDVRCRPEQSQPGEQGDNVRK